MDYEKTMEAGRLKLCQMRDRRKVMQGLSHDDFYYHVAQTLRSRFGVRVSPGWVRAQCFGDADPSFLRFGAVLNFLEGYDDDGVLLDSDDEDAAGDSADAVSDAVPDELDSPTPYLDQLRREHLAGGGYKVDMTKPNPLMLQLAAAKRRKAP